MVFMIGYIILNFIDIEKLDDPDLLIICSVIITLPIFLGFILFFFGRAIVGLQSRKINFLTGRNRTDEEIWFLNEMLYTETAANRLNFSKLLAKVTPMEADNIMVATKSTGLINRYFKIGKIYMSKNIFINRCILIISFIITVTSLVINLIS